MDKFIRQYDYLFSNIKMILSNDTYNNDFIPAIKTILNKQESYEMLEFLRTLKNYFIDGLPSKYNDILYYYEEYKQLVNLQFS